MAKTLNYAKLKKDMNGWPKNWAGDDSDIPIGQRIVQTLDSFVLAMMEEGLAPSTIKRHVCYLCLLGGEIIRCVQDDRKLRKATGNELVLRFIDDEGGPLSRYLPTEEDQRPFDGTCRKLYRYLSRKSHDE